MFNSRQLIIIVLTTVALTVALDFDWDCTRSPGCCNNACYAIQCMDSPAVLTYDNSKANRHPRRVASGCTSNRRPCKYTHYSDFGSSCDEYPFASTAQGGKGATLRCVDPSENSSEGGQLGNFYKGVPDGHRFRVLIKNLDYAPFCQENARHCVNDGGEFHLENGQYISAHWQRTRRENLSYNSTDSADSNVGTGFRKFMGSDGVKRLWLSKDTNGTLVGQYVWDGVGEKVLITSEISS